MGDSKKNIIKALLTHRRGLGRDNKERGQERKKTRTKKLSLFSRIGGRKERAERGGEGRVLDHASKGGKENEGKRRGEGGCRRKHPGGRYDRVTQKEARV